MRKCGGTPPCLRCCGEGALLPYPQPSNAGHRRHSGLPHHHRLPLLAVAGGAEATSPALTLIHFPFIAMLWKYSLPFGGMIDAPADLVAARNLLIEKIKADPGAFITKMEPAEPSCKTLSDVFKKAVGG